MTHLPLWAAGFHPTLTPPLVLAAVTPPTGGSGLVASTATWVVAATLWPAVLVQVSVYAAFAAGRTSSLPSAARGPLQPPDAVQVVALWACQASWALWPAMMRVGVALKLPMVGGCCVLRTVTVADAAVVEPAALRQLRP